MWLLNECQVHSCSVHFSRLKLERKPAAWTDLFSVAFVFMRVHPSLSMHVFLRIEQRNISPICGDAISILQEATIHHNITELFHMIETFFVTWPKIKTKNMQKLPTVCSHPLFFLIKPMGLKSFKNKVEHAVEMVCYTGTRQRQASSIDPLAPK